VTIGRGAAHLRARPQRAPAPWSLRKQREPLEASRRLAVGGWTRARPEWEALQRGLARLDAADARRLLAEVELLREELARARRDFARKAAGALGKRLQNVAAFNHGGCPTCYEAEARAFPGEATAGRGGLAAGPGIS